MKRTIKISGADDVLKIDITVKIAHQPRQDVMRSASQQVDRIRDQLTNGLHDTLRSHFNSSEIKIK